MNKFTCFMKLPPELRYMIWDALIAMEPGIHFSMLVPTEGPIKSHNRLLYPTHYTHWEDYEAVPTMQGKMKYAASLQPYSLSWDSPRQPVHPGDSYLYNPFSGMLIRDTMSQYKNPANVLNRLSLTCREARTIAHGPAPLRLTSEDGQFIYAATSSDVVCVDYPWPHYCRALATGDCGEKVNASQFPVIRRLAVRRHPTLTYGWDHLWETEDFGHINPPPGIGLYRFIALFPNLEVFYFLYQDDMRCEKMMGMRDRECRWHSIDVATGFRSHAERFATRDKTYYEIDRELYDTCSLTEPVFEMLDRLKALFIEYCNENPKRHARPDAVRFSALTVYHGERHGEIGSEQRKRGVSSRTATLISGDPNSNVCCVVDVVSRWKRKHKDSCTRSMVGEPPCVAEKEGGTSFETIWEADWCYVS